MMNRRRQIVAAHGAHKVPDAAFNRFYADMISKEELSRKKWERSIENLNLSPRKERQDEPTVDTDRQPSATTTTTTPSSSTATLKPEQILFARYGDRQQRRPLQVEAYDKYALSPEKIRAAREGLPYHGRRRVADMTKSGIPGFSNPLNRQPTSPEQAKGIFFTTNEMFYVDRQSKPFEVERLTKFVPANTTQQTNSPAAQQQQQQQHNANASSVHSLPALSPGKTKDPVAMQRIEMARQKIRQRSSSGSATAR